MKYYEITFRIEGDAGIMQDARDLLAALAGETGFETFEEVEDGLKGYVQTELFDENALKDVIADFPFEDVGINYEIAEAEYRDWNEQWEQEGFEPIIVDDRCVIHDGRHLPEKLPEGAIEVEIDAKLAFGTGNHETTRTIVSQLLNTDLKSKSVLDCGCGTGILCIAASLFGARDVTAYDIDDWSVSNAMHNAEINGIGNLTVLHGTSDVLDDVNREFDIVLANINRNILIADMHNFCKKMKVDATLILSGFYTSDIPVLKQEAAKCGLTATTSKSSNDWTCLILKKTGALPHPTDAAE